MKIFFLMMMILFSGLSQAHSPEMRIKKMVKEVRKFARLQNQKLYVVDLTDANVPQGLSISCPYSLECPSSEYGLFYRAEVNGNWYDRLHLWFDVTDLHDLSIEKLRSTFSWGSFSVDFSKHFKDKSFKVTNQDFAIRKESSQWKMVSLDENHLKGSLKHIVRTLVIERKDAWAEEHCEIQDAPAPKGCFEYVTVKIPVAVNFDLKVEAQSRDCRNSPYPTPGCGK